MSTITRTTVLGIASCAVLAACSDAPTGPAVSWVALETEPALEIGPALPTLPNLVARLRTGTEPAMPAGLERAADLWREAERSEREGAAIRANALRERAYDLAAPAVSRTVSAARMARDGDRLAEWVRTARDARVEARVPAAGRWLDAAERWLRRAGEPGADPTTVVEATMRAAYELARLTPEAVARRMIRRAEAGLESAGSPAKRATLRPGRAARTFERAERLVAGANAALHEGDAVRAIRRAFYALRLLDGR